MTKLQSLKDLRDKIKAGGTPSRSEWNKVFIKSRTLDMAEIAASGDWKAMAAAKALHEAVLHEYWWSVRNGHGPAYVQVAMPEVGVFSGKTDNNPARAWLLAILEALIAQEN